MRKSISSALTQDVVYMQLTKGEDRLNDLTLMHIHDDKTEDIDEVVDIFACKYSRKLALTLSLTN